MPQPIRILIAEDSADDAELLVRALRRSGFEPDWKRVDTEADFLSSLHPGLDIVISDYDMPQFTGLWALQLVKLHCPGTALRDCLRARSVRKPLWRPCGRGRWTT